MVGVEVVEAVIGMSLKLDQDAVDRVVDIAGLYHLSRSALVKDWELLFPRGLHNYSMLQKFGCLRLYQRDPDASPNKAWTVPK